MKPLFARRRLSLFWILQISGWLLYWASHLLTSTAAGGWSFYSFVRYTTSSFSGFCVTLLIRRLYQKTDVMRRPFPVMILIGAGSMLLAANLLVWLSNLLRLPLWGTEGTLFGDLTLLSYSRKVFWWILPFVGWTTLYFALKFRQAGQAQQERAAKARALAQSAQLQLLRYRLNPHFLFNSLNIIRALIYENREQARGMITDLSEFLRYSLISRKYRDVPLKNEIEALSHYLAIEKKRYEEKLIVDISIPPKAGEFPILSFLLFPLIENALKFGMQTSSMPLSISIRAGMISEYLWIEISNSGHWVESAGEAEALSPGTGVESIRHRLLSDDPIGGSLTYSEKDGKVIARIELRRTGEKRGA